jgi:hypothetical protein
VVSSGSGGYRATGVITAESNSKDAAARQIGPVGSLFEAVLTSGGALTITFLPANNVLLRR